MWPLLVGGMRMLEAKSRFFGFREVGVVEGGWWEKVCFPAGVREFPYDMVFCL